MVDRENLAEHLARTSAWPLAEWEPAIRRALAAGITAMWLRSVGPVLGPAGVHAALDADKTEGGEGG